MNFLAKTILVIDDEEEYRQLYRDIIESELKSKYREASNPKIAFEFMAKSIPDLIILDLQMPVMDGLSALNLIRSNPRFTKIKVIITSELTDETVVHLVSAKGVSDFIVKPFDPAVAKRKIIKVLNEQEL